MLTKLLISLTKLKALVLSTTSRTTATGDDVSVVRKFPPAWEDNDAIKKERLGGTALALADGTYAYVDTRTPQSPTTARRSKLSLRRAPKER